ncbi:MAG: hypothetical protein ACRCUP_06840 [Mycoplasmatales bacterium]
MSKRYFVVVFLLMLVLGFNKMSINNKVVVKAENSYVPLVEKIKLTDTEKESYIKKSFFESRNQIKRVYTSAEDNLNLKKKVVAIAKMNDQVEKIEIELDKLNERQLIRQLRQQFTSLGFTVIDQCVTILTPPPKELEL